ncbi:hypothetical protein J4Q44_G00316320 [Coregonus suidteri]|uniref:Uncharacterized protein n=1 Tax=Coregonus suidteri TaxID=861788 RepID=A0AAN8KTL8_9TELE
MSLHMYNDGYEPDSNYQSDQEESDPDLGYDSGFESELESEDPLEESREVGLFIEPTPSSSSDQDQVREAPVARTHALRAEVDQAVAMATAPVDLEVMVGEHHEILQSSSPEITRAPVCLILAPQVVPSWVTWFRSRQAEPESTHPASSLSNDYSGLDVKRRESPIRDPEDQRVPPTKRMRGSEDSDSFLIPRLPPWVTFKRTRESGPSSRPGCFQLEGPSRKKWKRSVEESDIAIVPSVTRQKCRRTWESDLCPGRSESEGTNRKRQRV